MKYLWLLLLLLLPITAHAQTMVLACGNAWGSSSNCGGCSGITWRTPAADVWVKNDASDFWTRMDALAATAGVSIATGKTEGATASCSEVTGTKTVAELLGTTPSPPTTQPPMPSTGSLTLNWTPPITNTDDSTLSNLAGYRVEYGTSATLGQTKDVGNVLTYTLTGLAAGTWYAAVRAINSAGVQSDLGNPVSASVSVATTPPPSPPPPTGPVVVAVVAGLNMSPIFGVTSTGARGTTVLGFVPIGTPCTGASVYSYRSQTYYRFDTTKVAWWASTPTTYSAVACK